MQCLHHQAGREVILLTAHGTIPDAVQATQMGAFGFLTKPVEYDGFIDAIRRLGLFLQIVQRPRNGSS